jgi:hypothetical protein
MQEGFKAFDECRSGRADGTAMILLGKSKAEERLIKKIRKRLKGHPEEIIDEAIERAIRISEDRLTSMIERFGFEHEANRDIPRRFKGRDAYLTIRDRYSYGLADYLTPETPLFKNQEEPDAPNLEKIFDLKIHHALYLKRSCFNNHLPQDAVKLGKELSKQFSKVVVLDEFPNGHIKYDSRED